MSSLLPINLDDLLHRRSVESVRLEFKASWDKNRTGGQALKTICAFANDYQNLNGGYVVIGVEEQGGQAVFPPAGLEADDLEEAQKWLRGNCRRMDPPCVPVFSPELVEGRHILVVWVRASEDRPHRAPDPKGNWKYWTRVGTETIDAETSGQLGMFLEQTARVPWDDRPALNARVEDLRESKVREHLHDVGSGLVVPGVSLDAREIYRRISVTKAVNDHEAPINVGLLFFSEDPERWFSGARIEVVQFAGGRAGSVQDERFFRGPLADQVRGCLNFLEDFSRAHLKKDRDRSQVRGWVSFPQIALREAVVNAVYHRGYGPDVVEPTKVYLYPDRIEVISYPGPVPGIEAEHLTVGGSVPPVPARNRRIGGFLKELRLAEGRLTGLPQIYSAMEQNGSPTPSFDFDDGRTYFRVTLPAHPEYVAVSAVQDAAYLRAVGSTREAFDRVEQAWEANQSSAALAIEMIRLHAARDRFEEAEAVFARFRECGLAAAVPNVANVLMETLWTHQKPDAARRVLGELSEVAPGQDTIETAILARRLHEWQAAHRYFERAGDTVRSDTRALHEFAQTKMDLARQVMKERGPSWREVNRRFLAEARELLERVIQMDASEERHAWAWRDLARAMEWTRAPASSVEGAFRKAQELRPDEPRFAKELADFRQRIRQRGSAGPGARGGSGHGRR